MTERSRSYSWTDPHEVVNQGLSMSGLEYLRAMISGELPHPPICATLGFRLTEANEGRCVAEMDTGEHLVNPLGVVHGSAIVALLDSTAGSAIHTMLPAGVGYGTVALTTNFLRSVSADTGKLVATGTILKPGRRIGTSEARLTDSDGRLIAHATTTCAIVES